MTERKKSSARDVSVYTDAAFVERGNKADVEAGRSILGRSGGQPPDDDHHLR